MQWQKAKMPCPKQGRRQGLTHKVVFRLLHVPRDTCLYLQTEIHTHINHTQHMHIRIYHIHPYTPYTYIIHTYKHTSYIDTYIKKHISFFLDSSLWSSYLVLNLMVHSFHFVYTKEIYEEREPSSGWIHPRLGKAQGIFSQMQFFHLNIHPKL